MTRKPPPVETRFKPGESGNPKGRPRKYGARAEPSAFDILEGRSFSLRLRNRVEELSVEEALQQKTYQAAIDGSQRACREVLKMIMQRETALQKLRPPPRQAIERLIEGPNPTNATEAMLLLGIVTEDTRREPENGTPHVLLEPWAVQMALERRSLSTLAASDIQSVRRMTRSAETLVLPKRFNSR